MNAFEYSPPPRHKHKHQFVIPVEWVYPPNVPITIDDGKTIVDTFVKGRQVTVLRCACGVETKR